MTGQSHDDGSAGEKDTIGADVENLWGGRVDDTLTGSDGPNLVDGGHGADVIHGGAGDDRLAGGEGIRSGVDLVYGDAGDDVLRGGGCRETDRYVLDGGPNTERGDHCVLDHPATGDLVDCERTGPES